MMHINNMMSPHTQMQRSWGLVAVAAIGATVEGVKAIGANKRRRQAMKENEKAKAKMERDKEKYLNMPVTNPYLDKENVYEDLTVNTQAADFAAEQNQQGLANTLSNMNQAAGGSGIAALAQALAGQSAIANQKASISIAEQERQNEMKERAQADNIDNLERKESPQKDSKVDLKSYVNELEKYVSEMEQFIHGTDESCNVSSCSESVNVKQEDFATILDAVTKEITDLLKSKNKAYGNTALNPPRIFSKLNSTEALCARLDDKLSRIKNRGINDDTEDTLDDVIGYLLLLKMSLK